MHRVLACLAVAVAACFAALPAASATPPPGDDTGQPRQFSPALINEIATNGSGGARDEFVEIINTSRTGQVDLTGWFIQVYAANITLLETVRILPGAVLQPLNVVAPEDALWTISGPGFPPPNVDQPFGFTVNIPNKGGVVLLNPIGIMVDAVAFSPALAAALGVPPLPPLPEPNWWNLSYGRAPFFGNFQLQFRSPDML